MMLVQSCQIPCHDLLFELTRNNPKLSLLVVTISQYNEFDCHGKRVRHNEQDMISYREHFKMALSNNTVLRELVIHIGVHHSNDEQFLTRGRMAELELLAESLNSPKSKIKSVRVNHCNTLSQFMMPITKMCCVDRVTSVDLRGEISNNLCSHLGHAICNERKIPLDVLSVGMSDVGVKEFLNYFIDLGKQSMLPKKFICGDYIGRIGHLQSTIIAPPISGIIKSENCNIIEFELCGEVIDSDIFFSSFAAALPKNKTIRKLILSNTQISDCGWSALLEGIRGNIECVQSTFDSNHTLFQIVSNTRNDVGRSNKWENIASPYLGLNAQNNKKQAQRLKIIHFHFPGGRNMKFLKKNHPLSCILTGVYIKYAMEHCRGTQRWVMEKNAYSFFYYFIRYIPNLADGVVNANRKEKTTSKRKYLG